MILAVSALDVAFVSALATVAAAVVAPLSAWVISKETRDHELRIDRERRLFDARRELYATSLADVFLAVAAINAEDIHLRGLDVTPHVPKARGVDDWLELQAQVSAIASESVMDALERLDDVHETFWKLSHDLAPRRDTSEQLGQSQKDDVARLAKDARSARDALAREMRRDLSEPAR
jgi:hypothetical protein